MSLDVMERMKTLAVGPTYGPGVHAVQAFANGTVVATKTPPSLQLALTFRYATPLGSCLRRNNDGARTGPRHLTPLRVGGIANQTRQNPRGGFGC